MPGEPLNCAIPPKVYALVLEAANGRLAIFAGAGLSIGAGVPSGPALARMVHDEFAASVAGYACAMPSDLQSVAGAMASLPAGLEVLQNKIVEFGRFDTAPPTLAHELFALLVAEGAIRFLTTNWDDCIERGWMEERIYAARDASEAEELRRAHILKIHGCCTRPPTLLVTEEQLREPPLWTRGQFQALIQNSTVAFVGVGDVPPYVRERIEELATYVDGARIRVVSPRIESHWGTNVWSTVLPTLSPDRRIAETADEFADELARGWLKHLLRELDNPACKWVQACREAFGALTAVEALRWLRQAASGWVVGQSVVRSAEAPAALKAAALLGKQEGDLPCASPYVKFETRAGVKIGDQRLVVLLGRPSQPTGQLQRLARQRAEAISASLGADFVTVLCSASMPEGPRVSTLSSDDVFAGETTPNDLITGPMQVPGRLVWADKLLEAA